MTKYDIAVIGSGIGGLSSAAIMAKQGFKVVVIEKQKIPGGYLQSFTRFKKNFDTGLHYIGSMGQGQFMDKIFNYLGINDKVDFAEFDNDAFDIIYFNNKTFELPIGLENFKKALINYFPSEESAIIKYIDLINEIVDSLHVFNLRVVPDEYDFHNQWASESAYKVICGLTSNVELQNILSSANILYAGTKESTSFYTHAIIQYTNIQGCKRPIDGGNNLVNGFIDIIKENGGKVICGNGLKSFNIIDNNIESINLDDDQRVIADNYISTIHPQQLVNKIGVPYFRKAYINRVNSIKNTMSSFVIYCTLKPGTIKYSNQNHFCFTGNDVWVASNYSNSKAPDYFYLLTPAHTNNDKFSEKLEIVTLMDYSVFDEFIENGIVIDRKGYNKLKQEKADELLSIAAKYFPDHISAIDKINIATPHTFQRYSDTIKGSSYGMIKDYKKAESVYFNPRTRIPNLFLAGSNINTHGIVGSAITSVLTCGKIVGLNKLINDINNG